MIASLIHLLIKSSKIYPTTGFVLIGTIQSGRLLYDGNIVLFGFHAAGTIARIFSIQLLIPNKKTKDRQIFNFLIQSV
jgi:hypothetical protein